MNVLAVMQNLYSVHGKPAWSSQFLIACVNASGRFTAMRYDATGQKGTDSEGCIAWASDKSGQRLDSPEVTIGMAKSEGWYGKNGSKWKTMPQLMLRYRAATLFARLYAPELTMGIHTDDEIVDIVEAPKVTTSPSFVAKEETKPKAKKKETAPVVEVEPVAVEVSAGTLGEVTATEAAKSEDKSFEEIVDGESPEIATLRDAMKQHGITEGAVIAFCRDRGLLKEGSPEVACLKDIQAAKVSPLTKNILAGGETCKKIKESK